MIAISKILAAAMAVMIIAPAYAIQPRAVAPRASLTIVAFGSSSTQGVGASTPAASYPSQLEILLRHAMPGGPDVSVINRGVGGEDADDMATRLKPDVIARRPDLVIWQTGSNDPMRRVPLQRFESETRDGIRAMQGAGIAVMLMEPQWCPRLAGIDGAEAYRDVVRKVGAETGVAVIRRYDLMQSWLREGVITQTEMIADDDLHMRDKGYALLARSVAAVVLARITVARRTPAIPAF